ncbi:MAG TPA: glutathione binding-like protein [Polyangiales bacterium]
MRLFGHPRGASTRRVLLTLAEKGHQVELLELDPYTGEHLRPEHLARHPFGKVPALEDGSFLLYEAGAITRYLDETLSGPRLIPASARDRARMEQWLSSDAAYLTPALEPLLSQLVLHPMFGARPDPAEVQRGRREVAEVLDVLERSFQLGDGAPFVAGALFSLADIALACSLQLLHDTRQEDLFGARPQVARWWTRVRSRPASQKVLGNACSAGARGRLRAVAGGLAEAR